ncbi:MAG: AEC family transporter [Methyloligellaceae bacterium]
MLQVINAIVPIFLVIIVGHMLRRSSVFGDDSWTAIGNICYYVLFPCMLAKTLYSANLTGLPFYKLSIALVGGTLISGALLIASRRLYTGVFGMTNASFTSIFQGVTRWNGFMGIAIITGFYEGDDRDYALTIIALVIAIMVPLINIFNVTVLAMWGDVKDQKIGFKTVMTGIATNPFISACIVGVSLNLLPIEVPKVLFDGVSIISGGALGLSLMAIGAGLRFSEITSTQVAIFFGVFYRLLGMPLIMFALTIALGIDGIEQTVAVIASAVPTASASYVLAQKMGGDATLMANIIALQVLMAGFTLPAVILLAEAF